MRSDRQQALISDQQQITVGRRLGDGIGCDHPGAACAVLDHDGVAALGELLSHDARENIADTSRCGGHQDLDRA